MAALIRSILTVVLIMVFSGTSVIDAQSIDQADRSEIPLTGYGVEQVWQPAVQEAGIAVYKIVISESKILKQEEIDSIKREYEGKQLTITQLQAIVKDINDLYAKKGNFVAQAILPPQKVVNGLVYIRLVEGRVGKMAVEGNKYTKSSFVLDRISLKKGDLVNLGRLNQDIGYFNQTNDVRLQADVKPGQDFGTTDCIIRVQEPDNSRVVIFTDNYGHSTTSQYRTGLTVDNLSLSGNRDSLNFTGLNAGGNFAGAISYSSSVNNRGMRLGIGYDKNKANIISGPFEALDISAQSSDFYVSVGQPLHASNHFKADVSVEWHERKSGTLFFGEQVIDSVVRTGVLAYSTLSYDQNGAWYTRQDITRGLGGSSNVRGFSRYNLTLARQHLLGKDRNLILHATTQITGDHYIPSSELFTIGGVASVRGFSEGLRSADHGYLVTTEYSFPLSINKKFRGSFFIDHGAAGDEPLTSVGIGALLNFSGYQAGRISVAMPLGSYADYNQNVRVHFFFQSTIR